MESMKTIAAIYFLSIPLLSLVSFVAYGWDKRRAKLAQRRVPERTLHWLAVLGGWPGAMAGQRTFRHKTQKTSFRIVFWLSVTAHLAITATIITLLVR